MTLGDESVFRGEVAPERVSAAEGGTESIPGGGSARAEQDCP